MSTKLSNEKPVRGNAEAAKARAAYAEAAYVMGDGCVVTVQNWLEQLPSDTDGKLETNAPAYDD